MIALTLAAALATPPAAENPASTASRRTAAASLHARPGGDFAVGPDPTWVLETEVPPPSSRGEGTMESELLLEDHQVRVGQGPITQYWRRVRRVHSGSGVQNSSEPEIEFDPAYEQLTLHHAWILREGRTIDALDPATVQVMQAESERDRRLYSGRLTAIVFLRGVRPGDTLDLAWSRTGYNPIFQERFSGELALALAEPVRRLRHVLVLPMARRPPLWRTHGASLEPRIATQGDRRVMAWQVDDAIPPDEDGDVPADHDPYPFVEVSEFSDWADVTRWSLELFEQAGRGSDAVPPLLEPWRRESASGPELALRAIRFVQDEIRYLGIEVGINSHAPHAPDEVLGWRYGDCKDKALLLSVLLRGLGYDAVPALVNTELGAELDRRLPSPYAFDHVIVRARIEGRAVWVDPTLSNQGGGLDAIAVPTVPRALLVERDTRALTRVESPPPSEPLTRIEERWELRGSRAQLSVTATYRGRDADDMRADLTQRSPREIAREYLNQYARYDSSIRVTDPLQIEDDRDRNLLVTREGYDLPGFHRSGRAGLRAWLFEPQVKRPRTVLRTAPLAVEHPVWLHQTISVQADPDGALARAAEEVVGPAFRFGIRRAHEDGWNVHRYEFRSTADRVPAPETSAHLRALDDLADRLEIAIGGPPAQSIARRRPAPIGIVLAFSAAALAMSVLLLRSRRRA